MSKSEKTARGLSKRIGDTGFSLTCGAHYPWSYVLYYNGEPVAGVSDDFFRIARAALSPKVQEGE